MLFLIAAILLSDLSGPVVGVTDGDTVRVLVREEGKLRPVKVRLSEIDAPESGQPFGVRSHQALARRIFLRWVRVEVSGVDRYKRPLGTLYLGSENINHWLVREGWAWRYDRYSRSEELLRLQGEARRERRGLWVDKEPVPPWEFRRPKRER